MLLVYGAWHLIKNRYSVHGIDVSHYQGEIDWKQVRGDGIAFAYIKATEGRGIVDAEYLENIDAARKTGIATGAYHFFRADVSGKSQAEHFLKYYQAKKGDLPPMLDMETIDAQSAANIRKEAIIWLEIVKAKTGMKPFIYTLPHYANSYLQGKLSDYPLWVCDLDWFAPEACTGWKAWTFWQYKHTGSVAGINGDVDLNYFFGSAADLEKLRLH